MSVPVKLKETFGVLREIAQLIHTRKKWWLIPIFAVFAVLSLFLALVGGPSILPAIYVLF